MPVAIVVILFSLLIGILLALPISLFLDRMYATRVKTSMRESLGRTAESGAPRSDFSAPPRTSHPARPDLQLHMQDATTSWADDDSRLLRRAQAGPRKGLLPYALAGMAYAAVAAVAAVWSNDLEARPVPLLALAAVWCWPIVLTAMIITASSAWQRFGLGIGFILLLVLLMGFTDERVAQEVAFTAVLLAFGTIALAPFFTRRLRAIGPLVLMITFGTMVGVWTGLAAVAQLDTAVDVEARPLTGLVLLIAAVCVPVVASLLVAASALRLLGNNYRAQRVSDNMVAADTRWLCLSPMLLAYLGAGGSQQGQLAPTVAVLAWTLGAIAAYRTTLWLTCAVLFRSAGQQHGSRLLLLRVFGDRHRSERLMSRIGRSWRYIGSVQLIAGPDLALANLEPHEFMSFVSGSLSREFISGPEELRQRLENSQSRPDPDGRFRVNEFFCHDDTWRVTLQALARSSDAVLMDLRGFSRERAGCIYELGQLLELVPLGRVTLLVDDTTDHDFLAHTLHESWRTMDDASLNLGASSAHLQILNLSGSDRKATDSAVAAAISGIKSGPSAVA